LYSALKRLLDLGWIARVVVEIGFEDGRERKVYRLTDRGRRILNTETVRLASFPFHYCSSTGAHFPSGANPFDQDKKAGMVLLPSLGILARD